MQASTPRIIECLRAVLARDIAPDLRSPHAVAQLALVDVALRELSARATGKRQRLIRACQAQRQLVAEGRRLLAAMEAAHTPDPSLSEPPVPDLDETDDSLTRMVTWEQVQEASDRVRGELASLAQAVVAGLGRSSAPRPAEHAARSWIEAVVRDELGRAAEIVSDSVPVGAAVEPLPDLDAGDLGAYFAARLRLAPRPNWLLRRISGGFSRETYSIEAASGGRAGWIIRKERRGGLMENIALTLANEYPILALLFEKGLPVPRPLWLETDESPLGGAFAVVERAPGEVLGSAVKISTLSESVMQDIARVLAQLHTTIWEDREGVIRAALRYPPDVRLSMRSVFDTTLSRWNDFMHQRSVTSPSIAAAMQWLAAHPPDDGGRLCLLHGDYGLHNMLFKDDRMTALLDWEHASLGDPARDLVQIRRQLTQFVAWPQFMRWYREAGGPDVTDESLRYYEVYSATNAMITMLVALEFQFEHQSPAEIKYLELGLSFLPHYARLFESAAAPVWS
jgi:aminoglycoside phosphotransferase (APT) family kinase protein